VFDNWLSLPFHIPLSKKASFNRLAFFICLSQQLSQLVIGFLLLLSYYPAAWIEFQLAKIVKIVNYDYKQGENFAFLWS